MNLQFKPASLLFASLAGCMVLLFTFAPGLFGRYSGYEWLGHQAAQGLDDSLSRNTAVFASVSGIKALLGVVEGSSVGVSLGASVALQLGDLVQPAYQYLDFIWTLFLYALFLTSFYQLLIESNILLFGLPLASIGVLLLSLFQEEKGSGRLSMIARSFIVGGMLISYGVPIAVLATAGLTSSYVEPLRDQAWEKGKLQLAELKTTIGELSKVQEKVSILRPGESFHQVVEAGGVLGEKASNIAWSSFSSLLSYLSALLIELLLLPVALFLCIKVGMQWVLNFIVQKN